ncbi:hypothetical protein ACXWSV_09055, partial [Streptococcus pyogenes]
PCTALINCTEIEIGSKARKMTIFQYVDSSSDNVSAGFIEPFQIPAASGGGNWATFHETSGPSTGHYIYDTTEANAIYSIPQSSGGGFNFL